MKKRNRKIRKKFAPHHKKIAKLETVTEELKAKLADVEKPVVAMAQAVRKATTWEHFKKFFLNL